ncbi:hypothetical protein M2451_002886 [Dysgonomonas sp. PFB1-18]|uniref:hypothetical protein n=1 Tax=unclassified Dysgonomonas TaxID=2630389 RepID=UPI0013D7FD8B|nr:MULTISPECIES: hypothetical protein [unclassified Dysgonomonas]MDH6309996.1 hypothetical protein [Dysgonomonas sp. PF1-14]MDH6339905.1 hypothetical protein [Dysgonomonas sp. PF1-16]MDH6381553.1 hypothetical protein [Dysgonomonas sp. PFB1-18]MDH6398810.1 hypothetical protein [Dysgonomonas sp. PF1-23]NDV93654.1 hypothetical protein [Dysgonomonas sp. 521]
MSQESMEDWMQDAKDLAKVERELKIEHWVYITFEVRDENRSREVLHIIDLPRAMLDRWRWVIEWRRAKLVCKYPRKKIMVYHCAYDKRTGLQTGFDFLLSKVASAKAQITKVERRIAEYTDYMTHNDLFFNPETDERLLKANAKLEQKKKNYNEAYAILQAEVEKHKNNKDMYKLFVGFKKLGEFKTISEAKQFADNCGETGVFNLIGDKYRDSWYVFPDFKEKNKPKDAD